MDNRRDVALTAADMRAGREGVWRDGAWVVIDPEVPAALVELRLDQLTLIGDLLYENAGALVDATIDAGEPGLYDEQIALVNETYDLIRRSASDLEPAEG